MSALCLHLFPLIPSGQKYNYYRCKYIYTQYVIQLHFYFSASHPDRKHRNREKGFRHAKTVPGNNQYISMYPRYFKDVLNTDSIVKTLWGSVINVCL